MSEHIFIERKRITATQHQKNTRSPRLQGRHIDSGAQGNLKEIHKHHPHGHNLTPCGYKDPVWFCSVIVNSNILTVYYGVK